MGLQDDRGILGAQGVASGGVLQAHYGNDVAGAEHLSMSTR